MKSANLLARTWASITTTISMVKGGISVFLISHPQWAQLSPSLIVEASPLRRPDLFCRVGKASRPRSIVMLRTIMIAGLGLPHIALAQKAASAHGEAFASATVMEQIAAMGREKNSWTPVQRKISSKLLLETRQRLGRPITAGLPEIRSAVEVDAAGLTLVDIKAEVSDGLLRRIQHLGGQVINSHVRYSSIRALVPIAQLEILAGETAVKSIKPSDKLTTHKVDTSQGVVTHCADSARTSYGVDGTGVRVGILSDSVESLASLQASGDLPAGVTVLSGQAGSGRSEGTAMLEIVHDIAPGAGLYFATANGGQAQFAQNILALQAVGCKVIVDDCSYYEEPVFQDGIIAQAVEIVTAAGCIYFSAAGNEGNLNDGTSGVWEGDFVAAAGRPTPITSGTAHDFGAGINYNTITVDSPSFFNLKWADALGASANDYDLYLLNSTRTTIYDYSVDLQDGNDDPYESIDSFKFNDTGNTLVIIQKTGGKTRFLHLSANRGRFSRSTAGQIGGHSAAASALSVAAVDVATAGGGVFVGGAANPVERFSSDGPRRIFYMADGTPITPGDFSSTGGALRQKPDIAAADGVSCSTPGFNLFKGTSAAAPHAAGIAALMIDSGLTTPAQIRQAMTSSAWDIETDGVDRDSGWGLVNALAALGYSIAENVSAPTTPAGLSAGLTNQPLVFSAGGAKSSVGHAVQYRFGWGDGTLSPWTAGTATGKWSAAGSYSVVSQARCISGHATSAWSAARLVAITNTPAGVLGAAAAWMEVPATMISGRTYRVKVAMQNTGTIPWTLAGGFKLGSEMAVDTYRWGLTRVQVTNTVASGAVQVFEFDVTPREVGGRPCAWRMVKEGYRWFGATNSSIVVVSAAASPLMRKINCGGPAVAGGWLADTGCLAGQAYVVTAPIANAGAVAQAVYQSCRYGPGATPFGYSFPDVPNGNYKVKLHFSEPLWTAAGLRLFHIDAEGQRKLSGLDVVKRAGGRNRALVIELVIAVRDGNGLQLQFAAVKDCAMVSGIEIVQESVSLPRINCGGAGIGDFAVDRGGVGGQVYQSAAVIAGAGVTPQALYQTCRYGPAGAAFSYAFADVPNGAYKVRLHFSEPVWWKAGQRLFDVVIEGVRKEAGLDVWSQAGGINRSLVKEYAVAVSDGNGLQIVFTNATRDCAMVSGIEVIQASAAADGGGLLVRTAAPTAFSANGVDRAAPGPDPMSFSIPAPLDVVTSGNAFEDATGWAAVDQSHETAWIGNPGGNGWWVALAYEPEITASQLELTLGAHSLTNVQCLCSEDADHWVDFHSAATNGPVTLRYLWLVFPADGSDRVPVVLEIAPRVERGD